MVNTYRCCSRGKEWVRVFKGKRPQKTEYRLGTGELENETIDNKIGAPVSQ
jgi:hypothetical protein